MNHATSSAQAASSGRQALKRPSRGRQARLNQASKFPTQDATCEPVPGACPLCQTRAARVTQPESMLTAKPWGQQCMGSHAGGAGGGAGPRRHKRDLRRRRASRPGAVLVPPGSLASWQPLTLTVGTAVPETETNGRHLLRAPRTSPGSQFLLVVRGDGLPRVPPPVCAGQLVRVIQSSPPGSPAKWGMPRQVGRPHGLPWNLPSGRKETTT